MSPPTWLDRVLGDRAFVDIGTAAGRELMAEAILAAIPKDELAKAIRESALAVLLSRSGRAVGLDGARTNAIADLARELGNNVAQAVLCALEEPDLVELEPGSGVWIHSQDIPF